MGPTTTAALLERERELAMVARAVKDAHERRGGVVLMEADAGLGKDDIEFQMLYGMAEELREAWRLLSPAERLESFGFLPRGEAEEFFLELRPAHQRCQRLGRTGIARTIPARGARWRGRCSRSPPCPPSSWGSCRSTRRA